MTTPLVRETDVARRATVDLAPLPGTNVALMNALLHELIHNDWVDHDYVEAHTVGYDELVERTEGDTPRGDRHKAEHEIHHVTRDLARWSQQHVRELAATGKRYGLDLDDDPKTDSGPMATVREELSEWTGRRPEPALLLLVDLRHLHRVAAGVSLDWELLGQGAQAAKDTELLALTQRCHPRTLRQPRWANAMLKILSLPVLAS